MWTTTPRRRASITSAASPPSCCSRMVSRWLPRSALSARRSSLPSLKSTCRSCFAQVGCVDESDASSPGIEVKKERCSPDQRRSYRQLQQYDRECQPGCYARNHPGPGGEPGDNREVGEPTCQHAQPQGDVVGGQQVPGESG